MKKITAISSLLGITLALIVLNTAIQKYKILQKPPESGDEQITYVKSNFQPFYQPEEITQSNIINSQNIRGEYGLYIKNLVTDELHEYNADKSFYGASLYKIPVFVGVMKAVEEGAITLNTVIEYKEQDFNEGTGIIYHSGYGTKYTVEELLSLLMKHSDNTAQAMLIRSIPSKYMTQDIYPNDLNLGNFINQNQVTPREVGNLLEQIYEHTILNKDDSKLLLKFMSETEFDDRINSGLDDSRLFSHKIGNWGESGTWHDCGIILYPEPIVVCLMSENTTFEDFLNVSSQIGSQL